MDDADNINESLAVLESSIEAKEREFLEQEMQNRVILPLVDWQKGLIYMRKKKDKINLSGLSRSGRIGRGFVGVLNSFSRKNVSSSGSNRSISFFVSSSARVTSTRVAANQSADGAPNTGGGQVVVSVQHSNSSGAAVQAVMRDSSGITAGAGATGTFMNANSHNDSGLTSTSVRAFARVNTAEREAREIRDRDHEKERMEAELHRQQQDHRVIVSQPINEIAGLSERSHHSGGGNSISVERNNGDNSFIDAKRHIKASGGSSKEVPGKCGCFPIFGNTRQNTYKQAASR
jgi:hypothetical protein